jgi:FAD/FMN-containing dehydrogenase
MTPRINRRHFLKTSTASASALALTSQLPYTRTLAQTPVPAFSGQQVLPDDPRYQTLSRGFNLRWVGQPAYIAICSDTNQVVQAVQQALDDDRRITVRGGGHCYEDFVSNNDGGVIIDLTPMNAVWRDDATGLHGVEGGATLWDVYRRLYTEWGVTLPGGSCYSVGIGGHVTGGGYGLLARLHGLTVDFLDAVEVVHVTSAGRAEVITVSRDSRDPAEKDLLWGHLGGGGGNFGIVTKFLFRDLPQAPEEVQLLSHAWNWSDLDRSTFDSLINNYGQFLAENSDVDSPFKGLFALLHLSQKIAGQVGLTAQFVGSDPEPVIEFSRAIGNGLPQPVVKQVAVGHHQTLAPTTGIRKMPWLFATQTLNGSGRNQRGKYKSAYMLTAFPDNQIEAMWQSLTEPVHPNAQALVQIDSYGCQVNAVDPAATAIPQRSSVMKLQYQTYWTDPADDDANLEWIRGFYTAMYGEKGPVPDDALDGCYVNYPDVDLEDWQYLYYKDNYPRLQAVKSRWDPLNIFNHSQSIEPLP